MKSQTTPSIVVAEDDPDDQFLIQNAFYEIGSTYTIKFVNDGEELLDHLLQSVNSAFGSLPEILVLDLNMPKISGHQALIEIKKNAKFNAINVIVLSTSAEKKDIEFCAAHGIKSYYTKPDNFEDLVAIIKSITAK